MKKGIIFFIACYLLSQTIFSQPVYTFTGNGNWTTPSNWQGAALPPSVLPAGSSINIYPQPGDTCILDTVQVISNGANLNIGAGAVFITNRGWKLLTLAPILTTGPIVLIDINGALIGGHIVSYGSGLGETGIVWDTIPNPTVERSNKSLAWEVTTNFLAYAGDLQPGTTYYVRAYSTNNDGTGYGNELVITTPLPLPSVTIGGREWSAKNLDVVRYRNGDIIPQVTDSTQWASLTTGAWCYYNNDSATGAVYGKLYNWYAVNDPRGLAPVGWHVPSDAEWNMLSKTIDPLSDTAVLFGPTSNIAGAALKDTGTLHWFGPNTAATNSSGFTALPAGARDASGAFYSLSFVAYWWSSTPFPPNNAGFRFLTYGDSYFSKGNANKKYAYAVRCLKD